MRPLKELVKFGNSKLPNTTMIIDMGTSIACPSRLLGYCKVVNKYGDNGCYARSPEIQYGDVCINRRNDCTAYWLGTSAMNIYGDIQDILSRKRIKVDLLRFNENGDFWSQDCVTKLSNISDMLKKYHGITTYGYTARKDLNFSNVSFLVKSSGYENGNNGSTAVFDNRSDVPKKWFICPGNCKVCTACSSDAGLNIAFIKH